MPFVCWVSFSKAGTVQNRNGGNYKGISDSYLSVLKALLYASVACRKKLCIDWVPASDLEVAMAKENPACRSAWTLLKGADAVLVPGGFGDRGFKNHQYGWYDAP